MVPSGVLLLVTEHKTTLKILVYEPSCWQTFLVRVPSCFHSQLSCLRRQNIQSHSNLDWVLECSGMKLNEPDLASLDIQWEVLGCGHIYDKR